jgi:voltage-gated potassium channel
MASYSKVKRRAFNIIETAEQGDKVSRFFDGFILMLIVLNTLAIVLESVDALYSSFHLQFKIFEFFSVFVFTIEYIIRIWTSEYSFPSAKGKMGSVMKYLTSPMAIIDLLAILPFYLPMFVLVDLRFLRMFRISRLLRIFKLNRYTKALSLIISVVRDKKDELMAAVFVMGFMIMISSTMMYYFESEVQPEAFPNIVASFWWSIATLTTVGYGDIYPITAIGKLFAGIIAILGIGLVALPTGIISSGFIAAVSKKEKDAEREAAYVQIKCPHCGELIEHDHKENE